MKSFRASSVLLLLLGNTLAYDGCSGPNWRCGDRCILLDTQCNCGGTIFNYKDPMWCCQDNNWFQLARDHRPSSMCSFRVTAAFQT